MFRSGRQFPSDMRLKNLVKEYWPFLLPILVLLPGLAAFPFPGSGALFSDLAITHYPNALLLKDAIINEGTVPLWNPNILSGYPFIAHPYSGIWYPPYWAALVFPLPLGLNLLTALHLAWAGVGMYALLRKSDLSRPAAIFGGLAFEATPKLFAHIGAGHLMLVMAVCWTPWLLWAANRPKISSRLNRFLQPGVLLAIIFLIDPRWALYSGLLLAGWWLANSHRESIGKRGLTFLGQIGIAFGLALPAGWLYLEYAQLSTRAALATTEVLELSLPPAGLLGLVFPQWGGFHEWLVYPGVVVLAAAVISLFASKFRGQIFFWSAVLAGAIIISLGENIPGNDYLAGLPVFDQLRVPPRAMFLAVMAFAALSAFGFQALIDKKKAQCIPRLVFVSLIALTLMLAVVAAISKLLFWMAGVWAAFFVLVAWLVCEHFSSGRLSLRAFALLTSALLVIDLGIADKTLIQFHSPQSVLAEDGAVAEFLGEQPGHFRVYSPSYSIAMQTAAARRLELADGVDPLQLEAYAQFMEVGSGVPRSGYSVSLPPFEVGISRANIGFVPDPELLGLLNVKFLVSEFQIEAIGLEELESIDGSFIYENKLAQSRAWIERANGQVVLVAVDWSYNRIIIRAMGPGNLVLSEIMYPGWVATVDGQSTQIETHLGILRAVGLPAGQHEIVFEFTPLALRAGLLVPLAAVLALLLWPLSRKQL